MKTPPTTHSENHPSRRDPVAVGMRVRLHSGSDTGTIIQLGPTQALIRWDAHSWGTGRQSVWRVDELVILADQQPASVLP